MAGSHMSAKQGKRDGGKKVSGSGGAMVGSGGKPTISGGLKGGKGTTYHGAMSRKGK